MAFETELDGAIDRVWAMVEDVGARTQCPPGITRAAWSPEEEVAADAVRQFAQSSGLAVASDPYGNLHIVADGQAFDAPAVTSGSHMDTVPHGGNYDGFAGVAAGLAVVAAADAAGLGLPLRAVAMRCEESPWYGSAYLGSRLMLGLSSMEELGPLVRSDSGRTLAEHMAEIGYPRKGEQEAPRLTPQNTSAYIELHIEQGPLLKASGVPVGLAWACRGNIRFPNARCTGAYAHSAAVPRAFRQDAVLAVAELALALDGFWKARIDAGDDHFVSTVGKFATDAGQHAMTKVAGEVLFSLNIGSASLDVQNEARAFIFDTVKRISAERNVSFDLGEETGTPPTMLSPAVRDALEAGAREANIGTKSIPTVGHDAAMFARAGVPSAVVLVTNENGSHNPDEALDRKDFAAGVKVVANAMLKLARDGVPAD